MKSVRFLEEAQTEFLEQISFYEEQQKGLGDRFREAVEVATALAISTPEVGVAMEASYAAGLPKGVPVLGGVPHRANGTCHLRCCPLPTPANLLAASQ